MSEANKALARRMYEEISAGRLIVIDELLSENYVEHEGMPGMEKSRAGVRAMFEAMRSAFPDLAMRVEDLLADGDKVVVRGVMSGTHRGDFMGIPATGRTINVPFIDIVRMDGGRAAEHWGVTDSAAMMQQLGVG